MNKQEEFAASFKVLLIRYGFEIIHSGGFTYLRDENNNLWTIYELTQSIDMRVDSE